MRKPRIGFLGVGWIGRHRMAAMLASGAVEAAAIVEPSPDALAQALHDAPGARAVDSLEAMLHMDVDGVVIATPSALHAAQSIRALEAGAAVFCQKPLGRDAEEVQAVIAAARSADRLLGVDLSYRFTQGMRAIRPLVQGGDLGRIQLVDLTFHNAYGPDKPWFYDRAQAGGGCLVDLGVHLVDLALWCLDFPDVVDVDASLWTNGAPLVDLEGQVEDLAVATLTLAGGTAVRIACSWRTQAGQDAVIDASFYGTAGGAALRNVGGSFTDFTAVRFRGTACETLASPPDDWGAGAAADWARRLAAGERFDPTNADLLRVTEVLDRIYAAARR